MIAGRAGLTFRGAIVALAMAVSACAADPAPIEPASASMKGDSLDTMVPSMLLQPLVENSIKHGLAPKIEGGSIVIRSRVSDSKLIIEVEDDGVGMGAANLLERPSGLGGTGIGMANVAERLKVLYGDTARMTIDSHEGKGTLIRLRIPVLRSEGSIPDALYEERSSMRR